MKNRPEIEDVMMFYPRGIPIQGLKAWTKGEPEHLQSIRGRVDGAIMTAGLTPDQFRKMARVMLRTEQAEIINGYFRIKEKK